jgi:GGDEF domain-containing protein
MATLSREADAAMYAAKRNGRARWELSYDVTEPVPLG